MICQKCGTEVDNDLIFCTNCGERLFQAPEEPQTVLMSPAVPTQGMSPVTPTQAMPAAPSKSKAWIIWILAIVGVLVLGVIGAAAVFMFLSKPTTPPVVNAKKSPSPAASVKKTPTPKPTVANTATTPEDNSNTASTDWEDEATEVVNDRISVDVGEHYAVPFEVKNDGTKIVGTVKLITGETILGFVYTQKAYDDFFPNEIHKTFSFEGANSAEIEQTLVKDKYVIVFVNDTDQPLTVVADVSLERQ